MLRVSIVFSPDIICLVNGCLESLILIPVVGASVSASENLISLPAFLDADGTTGAS